MSGRGVGDENPERVIANADSSPRSDYEAITKLTDGFNGADLRNVATEAGMFAIREDRDYTLQE